MPIRLHKISVAFSRAEASSESFSNLAPYVHVDQTGNASQYSLAHVSSTAVNMLLLIYSLLVYAVRNAHPH